MSRVAEIENNHRQMVSGLVKDGGDIADDLNGSPTEHRSLMNVVRNMIEAGLQLDNIKKQTIYNKNLGLRYSGGQIPDPIEADQAHLLHMAIGIVGEASELLEAVVNHIDGERLDIENVVEELGDIEFYMEGFRNGVAMTRTTTLAQNYAKLGKRYEGFTYSDQAATDRADKA